MSLSLLYISSYFIINLFIKLLNKIIIITTYVFKLLNKKLSVIQPPLFAGIEHLLSLIFFLYVCFLSIIDNKISKLIKFYAKFSRKY